ncbi:septum formation protein Maf [Candidatus Peregrinibacteria bacterium CG11_big_fil_rev_8_21_14_0_20_41_10]|nr:MAG: septum formation protein Maf [Candidatus Peregrinibacteria bacterium CG11_big_fil_rev_8_21_14_0_20_41_10]PJC37837.1 MAG: septum formation protein Maf [Candidatus Peregrinibacteria bacterium CG_4_9_14_0_2_um_filter_41_14]
MPKLKQHRPLLLASESPRRIEILRNAGINFKVKTSPYEEPQLDLPPEEVAKMHALGKIIGLLPQAGIDEKDHIYIGVDTIVVAQGQLLNKPKDKADARRMLQLQQTGHAEVISGLAIIDPLTGNEIVTTEHTLVFMSQMSPAEIEWYLDTNEWEGKSGGFAIQGQASRFFEKVEGDILNVIGLPLNRLYQILKSWHVFT